MYRGKHDDSGGHHAWMAFSSIVVGSVKLLDLGDQEVSSRQQVHGELVLRIASLMFVVPLNAFLLLGDPNSEVSISSILALNLRGRHGLML